MRIFRTPFASVHPLYVTKAERKGRTRAEIDEVIRWLTGYSQDELQKHLAEETTFEEFFGAARLNPAASLITGSVCGVRVQDVEDPLLQQIRWLDKLVDELARGKAMEKVLRRPEAIEPGTSAGSMSASAGSSSVPPDRGPDFDGVRIGRPATGALIDAGHRTLADLPADLDELLTLHGVGPAAVKRLAAAR